MGIPLFYQIRVKGHLDKSWGEWFEGLEISNEAGGEAVLSGRLPDQAALHGILKLIASMGLELISVNPVHEEGP